MSGLTEYNKYAAQALFKNCDSGLARKQADAFQLWLPVPSRTITLTLGDLPFSWQDRF